MRETVARGWVPIVREGESAPDGSLYGHVRPLLALDCLPAALGIQQPLYGQQPHPCCVLRGGRRFGRSHAQLSTLHGPDPAVFRAGAAPRGEKRVTRAFGVAHPLLEFRSASPPRDGHISA